ncbi:hypothetical protein KI387_033763 [Taxus chinensis]|uniref:Uncharacterized protein n=1 Tax=Taxus chinensis TaxID=29808 RepID=A0AA38F579_TAXCH|nr:hypothetical protein KI387_033763 [Taxus chinensis]
MGNEMPNRNLQTGPEENSMEDQTSQQSSDGGVVLMKESMPKSMTLVFPEEDSGSGSKEETITNKDARALKAEDSVIEGDQQVKGKDSEENMIKTEINQADDTTDKSIDQQTAVLPDEESIKEEDRSSSTEELLPNDTECHNNGDGSTTPSKLEIADKNFDESVKISPAGTKQLYPESETTTNHDDKTESDVGGPSSMNAYATMSHAHMNSSGSSGDIMDMGNSDPKRPPLGESEVGAKKDLNLEYNEDKHALDKVSLQSKTQEPLVLGSPSADIKKMPSPRASDATGINDIINRPVVPAQMLSQQQNGFDKNSTEDKTYSATESCSDNLELMATSNRLQSVSEVQEDADILHLQEKTMATKENGLEELIKEPNGGFVISNEIREGKISTENGKIINSEMSNGFLHDEDIKAKEETMASAVEKFDRLTAVPSEKNEQDKQEVGITAVEVVEKNVELQSASEILQESNSFLLHQGMEFENKTVPETETGVIESPNCLQSKTEPIEDNQGKTETNLTVSDVIQEPVTLLSPAEHVETSDMTLVQDLKVEASNDEVPSVVEKLKRPPFEQFTDEVLQNEHDKVGEMGADNKAMKGLPDLESNEKGNMPLLVETKDKPSNTSVTLSANVVNQQTQIVVTESSVSLNKIEDRGLDFSIENKEIDIATLNLEKKDQAMQSQNITQTEEAFNGMTDKDEKDILEPEINKLEGCKAPLSNTEFTSNQTEEKSDEILHSSSQSNKKLAPQEQEGVNRSSVCETQKQDVDEVNTNNRSAENGMLSILDKELPKWPAINITTTASTLDEPVPDMTKEDSIPTGDKTKYTPTSDNELNRSDYVSCPKLESWHEESEDDLKTPLLATAQGSPEEKKESGFTGDLDMDNPKMSLERTDSEKLRTPLRHFFKEGSTVAGPEQNVIPNEQGNAKEKSVEDTWRSPAKRVSTPIKEKQKTKSIFSQCICCSAAP